MQLDHRQLEAAHQLGEAILRFVMAIESPKQTTPFTPPQLQLEKESDEPENRLLRISEAAQILALSRTMIYGLISGGHLPSVKIGGARRVKLSEVLKLLDGLDG